MAYSFVLKTGDGTTKVFAFTFDYLSANHLSVEVDGVATAFTMPSDYSVQLATAPANGAVVEIRRTTPIGAVEVDYQDGSTLVEDDLDKSALQNLFAAQEAKDSADSALRYGSDNLYDAESRRITNVADPVNDQDAMTLAYMETNFLDGITADKTAAAASAALADASATDAETAKTAAQTAQAAAEAAQTAAAADAAGIEALVQNVPALTTATGDGTTVAFTLGQEPVHENALVVTLDGVVADTTEYSVAGTTLTFGVTPASSVAIEVRDLSSTAIVDAVKVGTVADNMADVSTVATGMSAVQSAASNMAAIIAAPTEATNAANSATGAASSATAAASSATAAATSASVAGTSESNAATSESNAAASATAAAGSASAAATSASTASTKATDAASSAASALSSQTAAAGSATDAQAAQTAAETAQTAAEAAQTAAETAETNAAASEAGAAAAASAAAAEHLSRALFAAEFPDIQSPAQVWTFYDGYSGSSEIGVTKSDTVQTAINKLRLMSTVAANTLNYTHDAETGEPKGFYVHKHVTNLAVDTEDLTAVGWTNSGSPITTLSTTVKSSKSGVFLSEVADDDAGTNESRRQIIDLSTFSAGDVLTCSMEMKKTGANRPAFRALIYDTGVNKVLDVVNLPFNEAFPSYDITSAADAYGVEQLGNGVVRAWFTITLPSAVSGTLDYIDMRAFPCWRSDDLGNSSDVTLTGSNHFGNLMVYRGGVLIPYFGGGASQITLGNTFAEATPTTDGLFAAGNRQGTIFIDCDLDWALSNGPFFYLREVYNNGGGFYVRTTTGGVGLQGLIGPVRGDTGIAVRVTPLSAEFSEAMFTGLTMGPMKVAVAWDDDNISMTVNGETVVTRTMNSAFGDTLDSMRFGTFNHNSYNTASAYYRQWAYWPSKLADADLVTLTTL